MMAVHFVPPKFNNAMAMKRVHHLQYLCCHASIPLVQKHVSAFYSSVYMLAGTNRLIYILYHIMADCVL